MPKVSIVITSLFGGLIRLKKDTWSNINLDNPKKELDWRLLVGDSRKSASLLCTSMRDPSLSSSKYSLEAEATSVHKISVKLCE